MKLSGHTIAFTLFLLSLATSIAGAKTVSFHSGNRQVALVELFTSEGCSSCPKADKWFNRLLDDPGLWKAIVPVAFHVDYWDKLGWQDRFGSRLNSERQYEYNNAGRIASVYTPCFVVNGNEWRGWFAGEKFPEIRKSAGELAAELHGDRLAVSWSGGHTGLDLHVVILGFDLITRVTGGENRGRALGHQFVVLDHKKYHSENGRWQVTLPLLADDGEATRYGLALWVNRPGELTPLQATGGWLPEEKAEKP